MKCPPAARLAQTLYDVLRRASAHVRGPWQRGIASLWVQDYHALVGHCVFASGVHYGEELLGSLYLVIG